ASGEAEQRSAESGVSQTEWFKHALTPKANTYIGPVVRDPEGAPIVRLADGVRSAAGKVGVIAFDLDWRAVTASALGSMERAAGTTMRAFVVSPDGTVVGSTTPEQM